MEMETKQTTLTDRFHWIDALHFLLALGIINYADYWIITGNYRIIRT